MNTRCALCQRTDRFPDPPEGWVEAIQLFLDFQPHPGRVDGLVPCDRRVFEDGTWFCVLEREPLAEGHLRLVCRHHLSDLGQLRSPSDDVDPGVAEAARASLIDDLIIAHDVVLGYDERVERAVVVGGLLTDAHLHFDIVPVYRFEHGTLHTLGERSANWNDMQPEEKRRRWEAHVQDYEEMAQRLREVADRVIRARPGRRRAGLVVGDEAD